VAIAVVIGIPFLTVCGSLSDKTGRKNIMMAGCLIAVLTYVPVYKGMQRAAGTNVVAVKSAKNPVTGAISLTPSSVDPSGKQVPAKEAAAPNVPKLVFFVFLQILYGAMVYGPIAAYLVEAFPARIRYTPLSLPYHIGNGVFGRVLPLVGLSLCAATGNIYAGLYYPIIVIVAALTCLVGTLALPETHGTRIWAEIEARSCAKAAAPLPRRD
jgi:MFS family permease